LLGNRASANDGISGQGGQMMSAKDRSVLLK
jgi:hypothetical protein